MHTAANLIALAALAGCGTYSTYRTAEPLPAGKWQGSLAVTPGVFYDRPSRTPTPTAITALSLRRGVGADTDVGLSLFTVGAELNVAHRIAFADWQWALLGAVAWARSEEQGGFTEALFGELRVGAAATRRTSPRWAFTVGPLLTGSAYWFAGGGSAQGLIGGGFANAQWTFGSARRWHLVPELSLHATLAGDVPVDGFVMMFGTALARDF